MSSHHIVRENQEPALVIFDARAIPFEKVQELLEWMPTIVVLHTQVEIVLSWGIKMDVVLVPAGEETSWVERTKDQQPIEVISFQANEPPLTKAISLLQSRNIPAVNWLVKELQTLTGLIDFTGDTEVFVDNKRWSRVKSGRFEKWLPVGTALYIFPEQACSEIADGKFIVERDGVVVLQGKQVFWVGEEVG
jgi:thiamine pyrophosphokinase